MKKRTKKLNTKNKVFVGVLILLILIGIVFSGLKVYHYVTTLNQSAIEPLRELILSAARGSKKNAPVEAKTGDIYFPESRLFLPNPGIPVAITYAASIEDGTGFASGINVSTYPVWGSTQLYSANNSERLYEAMPKFQACLRGISVVYSPVADEQTELKQTVTLGNGRVAYVYQEKNCPELNDLADSFKNLQSY